MNTVVQALTCSVCLERLKDPRQLSCGHCFCLSCLEQLSLPRCCPECRNTFCEEPKDLVVDYKLQQLLDLLPQPCFYCKSEVETNVIACSHCQKHFCEICLSQHWRAIANKRSKLLQDSLRGFETPERLRAHCQSVVLESLQNAREECHRLIDERFNETVNVAERRYSQTNVKLPKVQLFAESVLKREGNSQMTSAEFYESSGRKLRECHETLENMYDDVVADLRNMKAYVQSLNFRTPSSFPPPEKNPNGGPKLSGVPEKTVEAIGGTRRCKMAAPSGSDTMVINGAPHNINTRHQCIVAMREYENKSLEELRWEDYMMDRPFKIFNILSKEGLEPLRFGHFEIPKTVLTRTSAANEVLPKCHNVPSLLQDLTIKEVAQGVVGGSYETWREQEEDSDESL